jgi:glucosamine kinase
MSAIRHSLPLAVGLDVGGTRVRLLAVRGGRPVARAERQAIALPDLATALRTEWRRRQWTARGVAALVVAARGVWTRAEREALARRLRGLAGRVRVVADAEAALLGALDGGPGILLLAGTGSIVLGRDAGGRLARAGGLGPLLGDEGSAFWLGREWLRTTAGDDDGLVARGRARGPDAVRRVAALAPRVIAHARRGDRRARAIVAAGQAALAAGARRVARRLGLPAPVAASWAGAVLDDPWYRAGTRRALRRAGLAVSWRAPAATPVEAAARLAAALAAGEPAARRGARGRR